MCIIKLSIARDDPPYSSPHPLLIIFARTPY
nr:MAG TPA: hypothetical protein [Caudoviricetes sp.]